MHPVASLTASSFQRGKKTQTPSCSLLKLEGVDSTEAARWYAGKRVACTCNCIQLRHSEHTDED